MADNHPEAARKHVVDSEALLKASRYDGAGYLAGYAVECTLKTLIWVKSSQAPFIHNLNHLSQRALQLALLPTQKTARYVSALAIPTLTYGPGGWSETLRYEPEGTVKQEHAIAWVDEARRIYDAIIVRMKTDGLLT
jgi:HEPN domain-containing protein